MQNWNKPNAIPWIKKAAIKTFFQFAFTYAGKPVQQTY